MPALKNVRWERFAQGVARGLSKFQAYQEAGYSSAPCRTSAGTVAGNQKVKARIDELIAQRESIERKAIETAAGELAIDRKWVLSKLVGDHARASNSRQYSAAIRALELIGKELGMFIERRDVTLKYAELSDDALAAALARYVGEDEPRGETEISPTAH